MKTTLSIIAVLLPLLFAACENQNPGSVTASIKFAASLNGDEANKLTKASGTDGILIDSAILNLQNINLLVQTPNGQITNSGNPVFRGPYLINLISRTSNPVIAPEMVTTGLYYGINGLLYVPQNTKISIYISGTYTLNDKWWKFYYTNSGSLTFQVVDSSGFAVDQANPEIWVVIDVVSFFRGVDFSKAVIDNDNIIRINESSNSALAVAIQNNFTVAATVSNTPPAGVDNNQASGGTTNGSNGNGSNPGSVNNSGDNASSGNSGKVNNSGNDNHNKDKNKEKEKNKNKSKDKHDQKDNNKTKDKNKDKEGD